MLQKTLLWLAIALLPSGCTRPPIERICPDLEPGAVVVSEFRGPQADTDTWGQWIELFNHSGNEASLAGVVVHLTDTQGSSPQEVFIRNRTLRVPAGGYVVLGRFPDDERPAHVQYGYRLDLDENLHVDGVIEVLSCGRLLDRVVYHDLPTRGTRAFDGAQGLDGTANDDQRAWCNDQTPPAGPAGDGGAPGSDGGTPNLGIPGTPGAKNRPCP